MVEAGRSEQRFEAVPQAGAKLFAAVATTLAAAFPTLDLLLRGMVAAGQGIQAICLYLGLTRIAFDEHLVRLGLPTPHDRPPRSGGKRPWSVLDTIRLMAWRMAGVHPETIALRLDRSVGSVRSKARRLGVPAPSRKDLVRLDPADLPDVRMDWWRTGCSVRHLTPVPTRGRAAGAANVAGGSQARPIPVQAKSGTAAATPSKSASPSEPVAVGRPAEAAGPLFGGAQEGPAPARRKASVVGSSPVRSRRAALVPGQRQMPLLSIVPEPAPARGDALPGVDCPAALRATPRSVADIDFEGDLTWVGQVKGSVQKNELAVFAIGMLFLGGLHWTAVSERVGIRKSILKDMRWRIGAPRCDRNKMTHVFDPAIAFATRDDSGFMVRRCTDSGNYFWGKRGDGVKFSPPARERRGYRDGDGKRRSAWVDVLTRQDIVEMERPQRSPSNGRLPPPRSQTTYSQERYSQRSA